MRRDFIAIGLFALALCANVILTFVLMLHFAPTHDTLPANKPQVCIVGEEDDMPYTSSVDYIRCVGCRVEVYDSGDREVICPPGYELPVMRIHG